MKSPGTQVALSSRAIYEHTITIILPRLGKQSIEHLNGFSNGSNGNSVKPESKPKYVSNKVQEAHSKDFDKQATITRLATLNTATEILKTHRKPIELNEVLSLASQLEKWALGE